VGGRGWRRKRRSRARAFGGCDVHVGWASLVGVVVVSVRVWDFAWVCVCASACVRVACGVWYVCVCVRA
jgi:hypothetical protein